MNAPTNCSESVWSLLVESARAGTSASLEGIPGSRGTSAAALSPPMRVYDYLDSYPDGNCPGLFVRFASRIWPSFFAVENAFADCRPIFAIPPGIIRKIKTTGERDVAAFRRHP